MRLSWTAWLVGIAGLLLCPALFADEGMWTFDAIPTQQLKRYGFTPSEQWLTHLRASSARLGGGCSASFVSEQGLVLTNHHCAHNCIQRLSSASEDLVAKGYYAKTPADERACPGLDLNQLTEIEDVTATVEAATQGLQHEAYNHALQASIAALEKDCSKPPSIRCDVVPLYHGGRYHLYHYRRYDDVRLVFAPEFASAFFGGDPDNFNFPRFDLDAALLRVYEGGVPAKTEQHLTWSTRGAGNSELTFVSGHPGATDRLLTVAQFEAERDYEQIETLTELAQFRGFLQQYVTLNKEAKRVANEELFGVENRYKVVRGEHAALRDPVFFATLVAREKALRDAVAASAELQRKYGSAWDEIATAVARYNAMRAEYMALEGWKGWAPPWAKTSLFGWARILLRAADERSKPNADRLEEYGDSRLARLEKSLAAARPLNTPFEIAKFAYGLTALREVLGPDHPFVKRALGVESPLQLATRLLTQTKLGDPKERLRLWQGGAAALGSSKDPLLTFARVLDADSRAARARYDSEVESVIKKNSERVAKARFEVFGTTSYPDATHTLRLSFGRVKGWQEAGRSVNPFTTFGGAFARATGREPFALPASWLAHKSELDFDVPLNFVSDNDIIGGNSGSPVVNRDGELVGLIFDGNIHSLGASYGFDPNTHRAVAVDTRGLLYALEKIYGAQRIVDEVRPRAAQTAATQTSAPKP